jgi:hypothetical protein
MSLDEFTKLLGQPSKGLMGIGAKAYGNPDQQPHGVAEVLDGDMKTYWEGPGESDSVCEVVIELPRYEMISGVRMHPNRTGPDLPMVRFSIYLSNDGSAWFAPEATGIFPPVANTVEEVQFEKLRNIRFIKISFSGIGENMSTSYVSLAEIELIQK